MAENPGLAALQAAAAKKRDAGGAVAKALGPAGAPGNSGAKVSGPNPRGNAIARRLSKGSSKSGPPNTPENGNISTNQESGY